ncbi:MAG: prepilin-type N-terminal cleavage/methylation domain-containing protein [Candidatus Omnitrophica bacterium]|nr:prepilin-type N-terminal cleavage/methylation domain-containing protein [Candidatus Omnitrophota bacterium]
MKKGFTLLELIVVIVILGILATLGFTQYSKVVESSRLAEAKTIIGSMRQLATEYYFKNGSLTGIGFGDLGCVPGCSSTSYYRCATGTITSEYLMLDAVRCTSGGKNPNASRGYFVYIPYYPSTGEGTWHCQYTDDNSSCFGMPQ